MTVQIILGDALEQLRLLASESVHCCVTSPPYFGLRNYNVAGQIGLEASPAEYVVRLVDVFREVRRVLRRDGTVWLNLGLSYASGDNGPSRSRQRKHVPPCDSDGKEPQDYQGSDFSYCDLDGEHQGGFRNHRARTAGIGQLSRRDELLLSLTDHDSERLDCGLAFPALSPIGAQRSTIPASTASAQVAFSRASPVADLSEVQTLPDDAQSSAHTTDDMPDTFEQSPPLGHGRTDKLSSGLACDCGSCGICFIYLVTKSLRFKPKDEVNTPHLVAMALQADGWFLRQTIIWAKPNPMPESVTDRCTKAHEYVFLLSKSAQYYYDADAIAELSVFDEQRFRGSPDKAARAGITTNGLGATSLRSPHGTRNRRSVWTVASEPYAEAHFATYPPALIEPCVLAGCPKGGTVIDPFAGAGTTGLVADRLGRDAILIELNPAYAAMARARIESDAPLFAEVAAPVREIPVQEMLL